MSVPVSLDSARSKTARALVSLEGGAGAAGVEPDDGAFHGNARAPDDVLTHQNRRVSSKNSKQGRDPSAILSAAQRSTFAAATNLEISPRRLTYSPPMWHPTTNEVASSVDHGRVVKKQLLASASAPSGAASGRTAVLPLSIDSPRGLARARATWPEDLVVSTTRNQVSVSVSAGDPDGRREDVSGGNDTQRYGADASGSRRAERGGSHSDSDQDSGTVTPQVAKYDLEQSESESQLAERPEMPPSDGPVACVGDTRYGEAATEASKVARGLVQSRTAVESGGEGGREGVRDLSDDAMSSRASADVEVEVDDLSAIDHPEAFAPGVSEIGLMESEQESMCTREDDKLSEPLLHQSLNDARDLDYSSTHESNDSPSSRAAASGGQIQGVQQPISKTDVGVMESSHECPNEAGDDMTIEPAFDDRAADAERPVQGSSRQLAGSAPNGETAPVVLQLQQHAPSNRMATQSLAGRLLPTPGTHQCPGEDREVPSQLEVLGVAAVIEYPEHISLNTSNSLLSTPARSVHSTSHSEQHGPVYHYHRHGSSEGDAARNHGVEGLEEDSLGVLKLQLELVKDKHIRINPHTGFPDIVSSQVCRAVCVLCMCWGVFENR